MKAELDINKRTEGKILKFQIRYLVDGALIGELNLRTTLVPYLQGYLLVETSYIKKEYQRQGHGVRMYQKVLQEVKKLKYKGLVSNNYFRTPEVSKLWGKLRSKTIKGVYDVLEGGFEMSLAREILESSYAPGESASSAYVFRSKQIDRLMKSLQKKLALHKKKFASDKGNWGYAGDLEHVAELLKNADDFMQN